MTKDIQQDYFTGSLIGLAIGDAMGAPVEFMQPQPSREYRRTRPPGYRPGAQCTPEALAEEEADQEKRRAYYRARGYPESGLRPKPPAPDEIFPPRLAPPMITPPVMGFRTGGPHNVSLGEWTDDTAMAIALAEALIEKEGYDALAIMNNWDSWRRTGAFGTRPHCFDIGTTTAVALRDFYNSQDEPYPTRPESHGMCGPRCAGNGGIMRLAPAVIFGQGREIAPEEKRAQAISLSTKQSHLTHAEPICDEYAALLGALLFDLAPAPSRDEAQIIFLEAWRGLTPQEQVVPKNSGYVATTYKAALWAVHETDSFERAILAAVNLGGDADTIGAVTGQIAGALYGYAAIPEAWTRGLVQHNHLHALAKLLYSSGSIV
jgi:ADP-ribosyl-[dinitrogen reductase] hydrolase